MNALDVGLPWTEDINDELEVAKAAEAFWPYAKIARTRQGIGKRKWRTQWSAMGEAKRTQSRSARETLDVGEPSDDWIVLEALISQADPAWWDLDAAPWDLLFPQIPF
jgi:hypothetical protein